MNAKSSCWCSILLITDYKYNLIQPSNYSWYQVLVLILGLLWIGLRDPCPQTKLTPKRSVWRPKVQIHSGEIREHARVSGSFRFIMTVGGSRDGTCENIKDNGSLSKWHGSSMSWSINNSSTTKPGSFSKSFISRNS